jgi:hypothetical protein
MNTTQRDRPAPGDPASGMTPAIFISVFVAMIIGGALSLWLSDNRLRGDDSDISWMSGANLIGCAVEDSIDLHDAQQRAQRAIRGVGGVDVRVHEDFVTGWVGKALSNIPQRAQFELAIRFEPLSDGSVYFSCASRPRFKYTYFGASRSKELANSLANAIRSD